MLKRSGTTAILFLAMYSFASPSIMAQEVHSDPAHSWTYSGEHGPEHWGDLSSDFAACSIGKAQSPIDITHPQVAKLPSLQFSYHPSPLRIIDNGHTVQVNYASRSILSIEGATYELVQFHFHHPSEEKINGQAYAMVAHLVHRSQTGKLAVVAVLIREGKANQLIDTLWSNLPPTKGSERDPERVTVNATDLLPSDHRYYAFMGSLTTPPCTEGVSWYVLKMPVSLSQAQISKFATIYPLNARPIQPLHGRLVQESK